MCLDRGHAGDSAAASGSDSGRSSGTAVCNRQLVASSSSRMRCSPGFSLARDQDWRPGAERTKCQRRSKTEPLQSDKLEE